MDADAVNDLRKKDWIKNNIYNPIELANYYKETLELEKLPIENYNTYIFTIIKAIQLQIKNHPELVISKDLKQILAVKYFNQDFKITHDYTETIQHIEFIIQYTEGTYNIGTDRKKIRKSINKKDAGKGEK